MPADRQPTSSAAQGRPKSLGEATGPAGRGEAGGPKPSAAPRERSAAQCCDKVYFCPTSGDTECPVHGGFDVCCDRPDLHRPVASAAQGRGTEPNKHLVVCEKEMEAVLLMGDGDTEAVHYDADKILCRALKLLGYRRLVDLYEQVPKWYA